MNETTKHILGPSADCHYNACMPSQYSDGWAHYAESYWTAANVLIKQAALNNVDGYLDTLILPALFAYRHWMELELKQLIWRSNNLICDSYAMQTPLQHKLVPLWNICKGKLRCLEIRKPNTAFLVLDKAAAAIDMYDPEGQSFRYPVNTRKQNCLAELPLVNIRQLADQMQLVRDAFSDLFWQVEGLESSAL